ncbi:hypothetical protein FOL47_002810 [Perkinsus chesapeaki]|uniref:Uncharacterized protein n=1 Tax=Perkinsus chesapeaki TaxID=330153 RepID=A0A7J6MBK3_PERCH|nr:hypothetical protein FOL47_002810 [Perkinsus chesapeaki]
MFKVVVITILVKPQLAEVAALGKYAGWDDDSRFYCEMTVKSSSEMQLVADVELGNLSEVDKCFDCRFLYGLSNGFAKSGDELYEGDSISTSECTTFCLDELTKEIGVGEHCRWNAYPENGMMVVDACGLHWQLPHRS